MENTFANKLENLTTCEAPFSFYELVEGLWQNSGNPHPMHRLCTLMRKMKVQAFVKEELQLNEELSAEKEMATKRCKTNVTLKTTRLTFFRTTTENLKWDNANTLLDDDLLGYAIVITLGLPDGSSNTYLLEAVIRPPSIWLPAQEDGSTLESSTPGQLTAEPITNYYVHNTCTFKTTLGTENESRILTLQGCFFAQQNDLTHVCAHAALRMAVNSSTILPINKLTNQKINELLDIDFSEPHKTVGHLANDPPQTKGGLSLQDIEDVVKKLGGRIISTDFVINTSVEYDQCIYPFVESKCPVILGIEGWNFEQGIRTNHVVSVLGHTLNSDRWEPEARSGYGGYPRDFYTPVTGWTGHYIINDDNFGMYVTLPSDMLRNYLVPSKNPNLHATMAVAIVPDEVNVSGQSAEILAVWIAQKLITGLSIPNPGVWLERLVKHSGNLVCRTQLIAKDDYNTYISTLSQSGYLNINTDIQQRLDALPDQIWVSEITLPHLYNGNKHKLGDMLIRASATNEEHVQRKSFEMAWFPGFIYFGSDRQAFEWDVNTHVSLIRNNDKTPLLEW